MVNVVQLPAKYRWIKLFDYYNDDKSTTTRTEVYEWKRSLSSTQLREEARELAIGGKAKFGSETKAGGSFDIFTASVTTNFELSFEVNSTVNHFSRNETSQNFEENGSLTQVFEIEPGGRSVAYQQEFMGPGTSVISKGIVTRPGLDPDYEGIVGEVFIDCELKPHRFLSGVGLRKGRWESDTPDNYIPVLGNKSPDINHGFSGSDFVWMIAEWSDSASHEKTCTAIDYYRTAHARSGYEDIASGAGGDYRYLRIGRNPDIPKKIVDIAMIRTTDRKDEKYANSLGYDGISSDFNEDRGNDYIYFVWKTVNINNTILS